ncbi:MAG: hypothetical protein KIT74_03160 [Fimbriimonadales bacterium]|nr:hypothetical protein [Fimbriimonadales bacterium]
MPEPAKRLGILLGALLALGIAVPLIPVPTEWLYVGRIISSVLFVSIPIFAIYFAAMLGWTFARALTVFAISVVAFAALTYISRNVTPPYVVALFIAAFLQLGLLAWASSLGILIACGIRDKNLLLPICFVLAAVDIIAVLAPVGTVKRALESEKGKVAFDIVSFKVPQFGSAQPAAQIGPADFLFLSMFFAAIHRFGMRARETLLVIVPGLLIYLAIVLFFGDTTVFGIPLRALPALVPIGLLVLAVNWSEFKLSKQEKVMTAVLFLICVAAVWASFALPKKQTIAPANSPALIQSLRA